MADHAGMTTQEFLPIPPTETTTDPIGSPADLEQRWRTLMGPLGFGERLLRFAFVGPDRCMLKVLSEVPVARTPEAGLVWNLMEALREIVAKFDVHTTVALLMTRPGVGAISEADRHWSTLLTDIADEVGVPIEPIFRANDENLVLVEPV
ncbi:MAG: hypothetical protein QOD90_5684 [Mycobacterium sp.]|jgi:hypothetical protein|nr:hypothetical protein [Mycobacterium sp.]